MVHAFFTDMAVSKEGSSGTEKPKIVKSLYNGDTDFSTSRINGRRYDDKRVMDVDEIWFFAPQHICKIAPYVAGPNGPLHQAKPFNARIGLDLKVTPAIRYDRMPFFLQKLPLLVKHKILAPWLLIRVMDNGDLHESSVAL